MDFGEAKEAIAVSLLNRVRRELSGDGATGEYVYGEKPSKRFATGFLMPMRNMYGVENSTENLRISVHGLDFQTVRNATGSISVSGGFSVYVRVLPTWEDLCDPRNGMQPRFMLRHEVKVLLDSRVTERVNLEWERMQSPPPATRGSKRTLRERIFAEERAAMGLPDLTTAEPDDEGDIGEPGEEGAVVLPYQVAGADIPDELVTGILVPEKWKRFTTSPDILVTIPSTTIDEKLEEYARDLTTMLIGSITGQVVAWLDTPEGKAEAFRPERLLPSDIVNREAWERFLARVRGTVSTVEGLTPPGLGDVRVLISRHIDFGRKDILSWRIVIENYAMELSPLNSKLYEQCVHQVRMRVALEHNLHSRLRLERIKPTYRFRDFFSYAALGVNCGVDEGKSDHVVTLATTWMPTYRQPRMEARTIPGVATRFVELADPAYDISGLDLIGGEYGKWVDRQLGIDPAAHLTDPAHKAAERAVFAADIAAYRREIAAIGKGVDLLTRSRDAWGRDPASKEATPYRAWLCLNEAMRNAWGEGGGWRLFQLTFILSHMPTLASRMDAFHDLFDLAGDEESATLLYFPTGGGKSEAFYGLLIFNLFLDRMRGKNIGVTALIRYPLRLLTIQQAQRLFRLLAKAEMVRLDHALGGDEFTIGFWVGSGNTPNRNADPELKDVKRPIGEDDPAPGDDDYDGYRLANRSYNKVRSCPHCGGATGLRRGEDPGRKVLVVCRNSECPWNAMHGGLHPLPFLITDDDIYGYAPAVVLGTIDKLALIGNHDSTINKISGMFGLARFRDASGRLLMPRKQTEISAAAAEGVPVAPACRDGVELFHDPFPSLIIADEGHLLEESLGTFASLFETALDQLFEGLAPLLGSRVARRPDGKPRLPKVIAATATISSPERQMETLYQRRAVRFPYPGTSLYESFYAVPKAAPTPARNALLPDGDPRKPEEVSPLMRLYASIITNGRVYAVATATILSTYHAVISRLWRMASSGDPAVAGELVDSLPESILRPFWEDSLTPLDADTLHSLIDLFRISLVYVNSKRGGDQVIESIAEEAARGHRLLGEPFGQIRTELISGGVDIASIQRVMKMAEEPVTGGLDGALREIVATSAISHGVDVDLFNAMFFVGAPNDISEFIQASSRVGRAHTGFSLLLPTPHSRRDRYIAEIHEIYHRHLEQMVAPAAVERWAANAIRRVMPSLFQLWLNGVREQEMFAETADKTTFRPFITIGSVKDLISSMGPRFMAELAAFAKRAVSVAGRGVEGLGRPGSPAYYDALIEQLMRDITNEIISIFGVNDTLSKYWETSAVQRRPMSSLRDIDEGGVLVAGKYLPGAGFRKPKVDDAIAIAARAVRNQATDSCDMDCE